MLTPKQQFIETYRREHAHTLRVLRAYPPDQAELRPHPAVRTARELAWLFVAEQRLCERALTTGFDWSSPPSLEAPAASLTEAVDWFEQGRDRLVGLVIGRDSELSGTVKFPTGDDEIGDVPLQRFLWLLLFDQIHHRGQFEIYLRLATGAR